MQSKWQKRYGTHDEYFIESSAQFHKNISIIKKNVCIRVCLYKHKQAEEETITIKM